MLIGFEEVEEWEAEQDKLKQQKAEQEKVRKQKVEQEKVRQQRAEQKERSRHECSRLGGANSKSSGYPGEKKTISRRDTTLVDVTWETMWSSISPCSRKEGYVGLQSVSSPWAVKTALAITSAGLLSCLFIPLKDLYFVPICFFFPAFGMFAAGDKHYRHLPPSDKNALIPRFRSDPASIPAMYSLGAATPFWLSGRIQHYGPVTVHLSSCSSTRGAFSCDFVIIYSASSKRIYNRAKPRKVQRLITWYDPTTLAKDEQKIDNLQGSLSLKRNAGAAWSITPVVTVYSLSDNNCERHTSKATDTLSFATAGTQTNSSTDTNGDQRTNTATTLPAHNDDEHLTTSNQFSVQHATACNSSMSPVTTLLSISGPAHNVLTDSQVGYPGSEMLEHVTAATIDRPEVNVLLARIAELEGVVAQQRTQIGQQAGQAIHDQSQDASGDKIWANRSTTLVGEVDAAAWAEAALVSQANTLAEKDRHAMQQNASIGRLQAVADDQDRTIKAQDSTISDLQARRLRGAFNYADSASKNSANVKQLQEELQAEKAARAADAQKAQADIATVKADAAEALAVLKRQSETETATVMEKHQIEVSKSTAS